MSSYKKRRSRAGRDNNEDDDDEIQVTNVLKPPPRSGPIIGIQSGNNNGDYYGISTEEDASSSSSSDAVQIVKVTQKKPPPVAAAAAAAATAISVDDDDDDNDAVQIWKGGSRRRKVRKTVATGRNDSKRNHNWFSDKDDDFDDDEKSPIDFDALSDLFSWKQHDEVQAAVASGQAVGQDTGQAASNQTATLNPASYFFDGLNDSLSGPRDAAAAAAAADANPPVAYHFTLPALPSPTTRTINKKKRKSGAISPPPPLPMEKGKRLELEGFAAIDMYYPHLKAPERTQLLYWLLCNHYDTVKSIKPTKYTRKWTNDWRVGYEKEHPKRTLWDLAKALSNHIAETDDKKPSAMPSFLKKAKALQGSSPPTVGTLDEKVVITVARYFSAHMGQKDYQARLGAIQPVNDDFVGAITCSVCAEDFDLTDTVPCSAEKQVHFFCKPCFHGYVTVTLESGPIQSIPCPCPDCDALFATADAKVNLSSWDVLRIEAREELRDSRVALAAKAVLHCECGVVGVVREEDMGNGRVTCPGCQKAFCCKCGNDDHGNEPCPPPAETLQWLGKHTKECPNCKQPLEKNGGCDHMTCHASAGGCGFEFWWTCGCPFRGGHRAECKRSGELRLPL